MARVTTITCFCLSWCSIIQLCLALVDSSVGHAGASLNGDSTKPVLSSGSGVENKTNNSEGGFSPITRFHPMFGYGGHSQNPSNYYGNQNQNHHQGQGFYPPHVHQHPVPNQGYHYPTPSSLDTGSTITKGPLYQVPFGYYSPNYGTPSASPPSSPYPVSATPFGGTSTAYTPYSPSHAAHYPHSHGHGFGQTQPPVLGGGGYYQDGFDVGSLPQQVRVPGAIKVAINGKDAEITCEFPKYLILIQGIYWHHKYSHDPFGTYYDTQNGFGTRITVQAMDQWKSALYIRDYSVDDFGTYRCISAAILPAEAEIHRHQFTNPYGISTRSIDEDSTTDRNTFDINRDKNLPSNSESPPIYEFESGESKSSEKIFLSQVPKKPQNTRYLKNSRKMKFPAGSRSSVRFTRQTEAADYGQFPTATEPSNFEANSNSKVDDEGSYDPFFASENTIHPKSSYLPRNNYYYPETVLYNNYNDHSTPNYRHLSYPYADPGFQTFLPHQNNHHNHLQNLPIAQPQPSQYLPNQNQRHLPPYGGYGPYYPGLSFGSVPTSFPPSNTPVTQFGLQIPYYNPSYSYFTVYQEVMFQPSGVSGRQTPVPNTSPYPHLGK